MKDKKLMDASCRLALAALLHDIGKFAERARIEGTEDYSQRSINVQLYCPRNKHGDPTHIHAAYTAIALDLLERNFPEIVGEDMAPFAPWSKPGADDSIINAAARHHCPETFLQWVIATADRVASGFERQRFEEYNAASDNNQNNLSHYSARQLTLFEQIRLNEGEKNLSLKWRYPLRPLSPESIFPISADGYENDDNTAGQAEYRKLWHQFVHALKDIPQSHRASLELWLDHFESLWLCFTHIIPSATAFGAKPEVSLYDHSKAVAALAVALWRYHKEQDDNPQDICVAMKNRSDWDQNKMLLVQGDFSGIQDFIFSSGESTQRRAAKLLRGRSFYVSLLTECAALKVLEALSLPPTSQVINAAGKFLIVAPNTKTALSSLQKVQTELDTWFLKYTFGLSAINLAWLPACCNDFVGGDGGISPFQNLIKRLFEQLEEAKLHRFNLARNLTPAVFPGFLDRFDNTKGECRIDGRSPAEFQLEGEKETWVSALAYDQVMTGKWLASHKRLLITRECLNHNTLSLPLFGYYVSFTHDEDITGRFGQEARSGNLFRAWDFSLPEYPEAPLWNGYARRCINAFVPRFGNDNLDMAKYDDIEDLEDYEKHPDEIKTLNHIARDDRRLVVGANGKQVWSGVTALMTLKGDVDNLGLIFQKGMEHPTFAKMAALSRQMNAFFTIWLPWTCRNKFPNTYTVFAGGDDFFLIGPWHSTIELARHMQEEFKRYVTSNPDIHFSAGLSMTKPGLPIRHLGRFAEEALDEAKSYNPLNTRPTPKNAVSCYGIPVSWHQFEELMQCEAELGRLEAEASLSTGYLYSLINLADMAAGIKDRPENALWHSRFVYRTLRMLERVVRSGKDGRKAAEVRSAILDKLAETIAIKGIERHGKAYNIALFTCLYQRRN